MCVDWSGNASPCVFMPYSPVHVNDIYAQGKNMNDVWQHPFFDKLRTWQFDYGYEKKFKEDPHYRNWMMPCPIRDHYEEVWNQGNLAAIDDHFTPNYVGHLPPLTLRGPEEVKQVIAMYRTAFPDVHFTVEDQIENLR